METMHNQGYQAFQWLGLGAGSAPNFVNRVVLTQDKILPCDIVIGTRDFDNFLNVGFEPFHWRIVGLEAAMATGSGIEVYSLFSYLQRKGRLLRRATKKILLSPIRKSILYIATHLLQPRFSKLDKRSNALISKLCSLWIFCIIFVRAPDSEGIPGDVEPLGARALNKVIIFSSSLERYPTASTATMEACQRANVTKSRFRG